MPPGVPHRLEREDLVRALGDMDTFLDITVDDLMTLYQHATVHASRRALEALSVGRIMSTPVVTVTAESSLTDAAHRLLEHRISGLPVVDERGKLAGVITEADFLRALGLPSHNPTQSLWETLEDMVGHLTRHATQSPADAVASLMTPRTVTADPADSVQVVLDRMKSHRVKRVVVCDTTGQPVGMVTRSDFVKLFFDRHWGQTGPGDELRPATTTSPT